MITDVPLAESVIPPLRKSRSSISHSIKVFSELSTSPGAVIVELRSVRLTTVVGISANGSRLEEDP